MFGLMKNTGCTSRNQPEWYRLHYCGTCKSIGSRYGQRSRTTLNYDTVFLAEMLTLISDDDTTGWDQKIRAYRCFDLPEGEQVPTSLQYSADVNILLADVKLKDNIADEGPSLWPLASRFFRGQFSKVRSYLKKWNIEEAVLQEWLTENQKREIAGLPEDINTPEQVLRYYGKPTAALTAYLFSKGAVAIGKAEWQETLGQFGCHFGELIYGLDAVNDYDKDAAAGDFNPLLRLASPDMNEVLNDAKEYLWNISAAMTALIDTFPFSPADKESLQGRLVFNLSRALSAPTATCETLRTGIEKSSFPHFMGRVSSSVNYVFSYLNPAMPGRFAWTYLLLLFLFFNQQLMAAVALVIRTTPVRFDWAFWLGAAAFPVIAWAIARRIKKGNIVDWLEKQKAKLKKKLAELKGNGKIKDGVWVLIILLIIIVLFIIVKILISNAINSCCSGWDEDSCGDNTCWGG